MGTISCRKASVTPGAPKRSKDLAIRAARAADDKQARDIVVLDVSEIIAITDAFVICSGSTDRQLKAIADGVERALAAETKPVRREGERELRWLLLDYIDFIVHIFLDEARAFYELERLWKDAPAVDWQDAVSGAKARARER